VFLNIHLNTHLNIQSRFPVKKHQEWHKKEPPGAVMRQTALVLSVYAAFGSVFGAFVVCLVLWRSAPLMTSCLPFVQKALKSRLIAS
jgi:hypothetical protein